MKNLLFALIVSGISSAQVYPPSGGGSGGGGSPLYKASFTTTTMLAVSAAVHMQGTAPFDGGCFDNATPAVAIALTAGYPHVAANGDITYDWVAAGSKTGYCLVGGSGAAGAAGGVLTGLYPDPGLADGIVTLAKLSAGLLQGAGTKILTATGTYTSGNVLRSDSNGTPIDAGVALSSIVLSSRQINCGLGLTGCGDLSTDRTLAVVADTLTERVRVSSSGTLAGTRQEVNFIASTNVNILVQDNPGSNRVDVTISATGGGGGGSCGTGNGNLICATPNGSSGASGLRAMVAADIADQLISVAKLAAVSGSSSTVATITGALTAGDCLTLDANGNIKDVGFGCGTYVGLPPASTTFTAQTSVTLSNQFGSPDVYAICYDSNDAYILTGWTVGKSVV